MIIKRITLHNFGVYSGTNTLEFSNKKPVVLIGGLNGRGKTTILNAILIALYGSNSFAYKESRYKSYSQYLKSLVNSNADTNETFVELEFVLGKKEKDIYTVKRSWNSLSSRTKEEISVEKNYVEDDFLTNNWTIFIENLIPSALSQYFFFDGDNIAELAVAKTDKKMKDSIRALLGITVIEQLESDIERVASRARRRIGNEEKAATIEEAQKEKENCEKELERIDLQIEDVKNEIININIELEKAKADHVAKGGVLIEQRQTLIEERVRLNTILQQIDAQLSEFAATEMPLSLVASLLEKINVQVSEERNNNSLKNAAEQIHMLFDEYAPKGEEVDAFVKYIENRASEAGDGMIFNGNEHLAYQVNELLDGGLKERQNQVSLIMSEKEELQNKLDEIEEHLSVDIDEKEVKKAFAAIKKAEQKIIEQEEILHRLERSRSEANGKTIRSTSNYNRIVEKMVADIEMNSDSERTVVYAEHARRILDEYRIRLQQEKTGLLKKTITKCYKQLANKSNMISRVDMDPETLDLIYINKEGQVVPKSALSEGEKQMMIISVLWALATCSKRKLPVIIDTPLARLDSSHRMAMVNKYFPKASDQTIILSTDAEITGDYYEELKKNISDEYTLLYDDDKRCSTIKRGYFGEVK